MKKILPLLLIVILLSSIAFIGCNSQEGIDNVNNQQRDSFSKEKLTVAVSIVPQEAFVKAVAGDLVNVVTMIPPGNSPANYQPTPKELEAFSIASIYFSIGVATEEANILPKARDLNKNIKIVPLEEAVGKVYQHLYFGEHEEHEDDHNHEGRDPHIWLSPKRVQVMIDVIKDELINADEANKKHYEENAKAYIQKLDEVDKEIKNILSGVEQQAFIIYHPSFNYFADDYGLKMVTIEESGKEATINRLQQVIDFAKKNNIKFVFYQAEFDSQQARTIADEIDGGVVQVDPLSIDYINNLKEIAGKFRSVLE